MYCLGPVWGLLLILKIDYFIMYKVRRFPFSFIIYETIYFVCKETEHVTEINPNEANSETTHIESL